MKFRSLHQGAESPVILTVNGATVTARAGETLALVLLERGVACFNVNPVSGEDRLPYCMMGSCFECRIVVDGVRDVLACRTVVRDGMVIEKQDNGHGTI